MADQKQLYECTVTFTYYAYARNWLEAESFAEDAMHDAAVKPETVEVTSKDHTIESAWEDDHLVYHSDRGDITLGELLNKLPGKR